MGSDRGVRERGLLRKLLPRIIKASIWGFIMGGEALFMYLIPEVSEMFKSFLPVQETPLISLVAVFVAFEVAIQLLAGTVYRYALSIARALFSMIFLVYVTNGGIMALSFPMGEMPISIVFNFRTILAVFLIFSLISVVKNLLQTVNFLAEGAESPITISHKDGAIQKAGYQRP